MYPWLIPDWHALSQTVEAGRLGHAWLLLGDPGLGKEQLAERLARLHLCQQPDRGEPCGQCHSCQLFDKGHHPDLGTVTVDSKTIGVDAIREICARLQNSAQLGRGKVVIIPDAERMTESAANALLKTLEEPAGDSLLLLIASQVSRLLPTILSRCHKHVCQLPTEGETVRWLAEQGHQATLAQVRICQGAPLRVLRYIEEQQDGKRRELLESFVSLPLTPTRATHVCSQLADETQVRLHWLQLFLCDALKTQAGCGHHQLAMPDLAALSQQLAEGNSSEKLLEAEQQLVALKAACQPGQLSNSTIHLMNWLSRWL
ncbi:DNA polymerase III subunit delta' [Aeromonas salmonicida]|uniref:DNA polymerase III subunit delta' n=1 Tax=Aeromonas salmonicida subsp. pectinolytica 34mel TaxID=1324960 RepID=T0PDD7_AERSA|nr:DNA polymerase III subunit delta' [Aeromonas salmonicida]ATP09647.1 DNA polymerase 3 delta' subunit [Aeromonas salmonicida subsp. pectinolytica 34mel]EQC05145.1 DNA polymerase III, delta' subunit [Aeromonas salmonicida subsp. pectinolytica 34mel]TNI13912.1 DNA polymerase III subunit delta' [Aeromonas salmonicida]HEH9396783.1 DNA polymerase III subunit delta' [Aeromonas salmonicida]HEH9412474.1 DNA polymerase III subunit delta' [Aeromonas salmonicida]